MFAVWPACNWDRHLADEPHWCSSVFGCRKACGPVDRIDIVEVDDIFGYDKLVAAEKATLQGDELSSGERLLSVSDVGAREWSGWEPRHGRFSREVAVERCGKQPRYNAPYADAQDSVHCSLDFRRRYGSVAHSETFRITCRTAGDSIGVPHAIWSRRR